MDPVTLIDAALDSVTVRVSVCPAEMLAELAVMETVGVEAFALVANAEIASNVRRGAKDGKVFMGGLPYIVYLDLVAM